MIARLTGGLVSKSVDHIVLDVRDVGYRISIPLSTYYDLPEVSAPVSVLVHTYVREDTFQLYGFLTAAERDLFEALLRVTKVGPKLALAMLSGLSPGELERAIIGGDVQRLSAVPGVGRKTAERIIFELREKLTKGKPELEAGLRPQGQAQELVADATMALQNLGYSHVVAERAIRHVFPLVEPSQTPALKELLRDALRFLGREKG
jgi:holliday junction DNA helicase RuvA